MKGCLILFSVFLIFLFSSSNVLAAFAVSPARYEVAFEPGKINTFQFSFWNDNPNQESIITVEGELAEYITLNTERITGSERVEAILTLPEDIPTPGPNVIFIGAREDKSNERGVSLVASIRGRITVNVPYPGRYVELELESIDANAGDPVQFALGIDNKGKETVVTVSRIEIYDNANALLETLDLGIDTLEPGGRVNIDASFDSRGYGSGNYRAVAITNYADKLASSESEFRLGSLFVDIVNSTKKVERGGIQRIYVDAESFWNDQIYDVYATGGVVGYVGGFQTPSIKLDPWDKERLFGHIDTAPIEEDKFQVQVILHYSNFTTERIIDMEFIEEEIDYYLVVLIIVAFIAILLQTWNMINFFRSRRKKRGKR